MQVTAIQVKELRERTGVGMAKCKEALEKAGGNMDAAIDILRKAGIASAVKKEGREAKEGAIFVKEGPDAIVIAEINCETDFVTKNEKFQEFCHKIVDELAATKPASVEAFLAQHYSLDPSITIEALRALIIQVIGENIQIRRIQILPKVPGHTYGIYSHMGGKIVTLVELSADNEKELAKDIAMHIAAFSPEYIKPENVPQEIVEKEKEIARSQIQGKPAFVIDKIIAGKVNAYFDMVCLVRQKFVKDNTITVGELIEKRKAARGGVAIEPLRMLRWSCGA
jgi:elongation factor Ts